MSRCAGEPVSRDTTLAGYAVIAAAMAARQVVGLLRPGTATFGDAVAVVTARPAGRLVVLAFWLWAGWHVFVRFGG